VTVAGALQGGGSAAGMVLDFGDMSDIVAPHVIEQLDHHHLNDLIDNPTCEHILVWTWHALEGALPLLETLALWETPTSCAILQRGDPETIQP
jgi:6-pyruvoyltetrahydropterin/6-carboxytetrahydropterin synthase